MVWFVFGRLDRFCRLTFLLFCVAMSTDVTAEEPEEASAAEAECQNAAASACVPNEVKDELSFTPEVKPEDLEQEDDQISARNALTMLRASDVSVFCEAVEAAVAAAMKHIPSTVPVESAAKLRHNFLTSQYYKIMEEFVRGGGSTTDAGTAAFQPRVLPEDLPTETATLKAREFLRTLAPEHLVVVHSAVETALSKYMEGLPSWAVGQESASTRRLSKARECT